MLFQRRGFFREVFEEYSSVLRREKISKFRDFQSNALNLWLDIEQIGEAFEPSNKQEVIKDRSDNKFLELGEAAKADCLITGTTNDFTMHEFKGTKIVTPKTFWEHWNS